MSPGDASASVHLITGEYPPQFGGVSDYTFSVARGVAGTGTAVHVWCPPAGGDTPQHPGITVHRVAGSWSRADLGRLDRALDRVPGRRRLVVQWVPHAFGYRSLNVGFCAWIRRRALKGDVVDVMVHEAFLAFREGNWKQDAAAAVHRVMVTLLLQHAHRVWVSIPAWGEALRPFRLGRPMDFEWLPVPSNVPRIDDAPQLAALRQRLTGTHGIIVGHFGTYEPQIRRSLTSLLPALVERQPGAALLLMGRDSDVFRAQLVAQHPHLDAHVQATGVLGSRELSLHLQACDLVVQPYPDGASARRGTLMAALENGVPVVTTDGRLSESIWRQSGAVRAIPSGNDAALIEAASDLCGNHDERRRLAAAGRALYTSRFDIANTVDALLSEPSRAA